MNTPPPKSVPPILPGQVFSLVETVLALGVVSFALTTLMSLMPVGLNIFRDSVHTTVQTDVLRQFATQFQETPFDKLTGSTNMLYFSDQSTPVTREADALFGVTYAFTSDTPMLAGANGYANANLKTAVVRFFTRADRAKTPPTASLTNVLYLAPGVH